MKKRNGFDKMKTAPVLSGRRSERGPMMRGRKPVLVALVVFLILFGVAYFPDVYSLRAENRDDPPAIHLFGRVMSRYGPVENARVRIAGRDKFALTDRSGQFEIRTDYLSANAFLVTAGKEGWFNNAEVANGPGRVKDIFLNPIYLGDQKDYQFISPVTCSRCHIKLTRYWDKSKMAHTTSNPKVLDMFYGMDNNKQEGVKPGYRLDFPNSNGNCTTCHAPSAAVSSPWSQELNAVLKSPRTEWDGISCEYCHKVRKVVKDQEAPSGYKPIFERQSSRTSSSILVFGPYDDVVVPPMAASYNPLFGEGRFCSTCHSHYKKLGKGNKWNPENIYTPAERKGLGLDGGNLLPIQTTYQEWKQWQDELPPDDPNKGKKCQGCHMSWRKEMLPYDNYIIDGNARRMWGVHRSPQRINPHHFDGGTERQLKTALSMELEGEIKGDRLKMHVYVTNTNGGHWVPTGETMRSVMLVLRAMDSNGTPLKMTKGNTLPEWTGKGAVEKGNYAGQPGEIFARVLEDDSGKINVPFWQATGVASDTRIRPKTTQEFIFEFALEDQEDEPSVEADLIYRPVIRQWADEKKWPVKDILITSKAW